MRRLLVVLVVGTVLAALTVALVVDDDDARAGSPDRPNVVVFMTDDQTLESMRVMPETNRLLGDQGTTFTDAVVSFPLCCPSRATFLTGQYAHNNGVQDNVQPFGGVTALDQTHTLPVWLSAAGYRTSHVGKYLNRYGEDAPPTVPLGWDAWFGLDDPTTYRYFNFDVSIDGRLVTYGGPGNYQTDVLADRAVSEIDRLAAGDDPFFLNVAFLAPHGGSDLQVASLAGAVPAPRHLGQLEGETLPESEARAETDVSDKPVAIQALEPLTESELDHVSRTYVSQLESLLAVDEAVARVVERLERNGVLDDTVIMFTSDNGFLLGEHGIRFEKTWPYEESAHVPLLVRGPGFPAGTEVDGVVANIDLAPTILDLAGAEADVETDGISLAGVADEPEQLDDRAVLLENGPPRSTVPHYSAVRTTRYLYVEYHTGETELYDLREDPAQVTSVVDSPDYAEERERLAALLDELRACAGDRCREP